MLGGGIRRAAGWLLLVVPLIPLRFIFDDPPGTTWLLSPLEWGLGLFVFLSIAWLASRLAPDLVDRAGDAFTGWIRRPSDAAFRVFGLGAIAVVLLVTSTFAFSRSPLLIDSIIQLFQSKIFASGHAWVPAPDQEGFFTTQHMVSDAGRWYSQYPPGHAGALAIGIWIGAPWLIPIALSLATAGLITATTRRLFGEAVARVALILTLVAPFFWFMGASYMNHVSALFFIALFFWCFVRWSATDASASPSEPSTPASYWWLAAAGIALGGAFLSRPLTAVAIGAGLAIPAIRIAGRRWWLAGVVGTLGFASLACFYFLYNAATTGDPLTAGYLRQWGAAHELGFHLSPWGDLHTPLTGLRNELVDIGLLHSFLFEWPIPALWPLAIVLAAGWSTSRWDGRLLGAFFSIPAAYFFYWHRDAFLGPRYFYEGLPFLIPLLAFSFVELKRRISDHEIRWLGGLNAGTLFVALVGSCFIYSLGYGMPQRFRVYATSLASVKLDLVGAAREAGITEGLVFIKVSWGNRLISRARNAGASASVAERAYRSSDHCELEMVVSAMEANGWEPDRFEQELVSIIRPENETEVVRLNDDPTLRLVPGRRLAEACVAELVYDRDGMDEMPNPPSYTNFSPHLADNAPSLDGPLVFARDLRGLNARLRAEYPGRPAYLYSGGAFVPFP